MRECDRGGKGDDTKEGQGDVGRDGGEGSVPRQLSFPLSFGSDRKSGSRVRAELGRGALVVAEREAG
jgi:hypothetical protein